MPKRIFSKINVWGVGRVKDKGESDAPSDASSNGVYRDVIPTKEELYRGV